MKTSDIIAAPPLIAWSTQLPTLKQSSFPDGDGPRSAEADSTPASDLTNIILDTTAVTSIANALAAGAPCLPGIRGLVLYAPTIDRIRRIEAVTECLPVPSEGLQAALKSLSAQIEYAQSVSEEAAIDPEPAHGRLASVAGAWRRASNMLYVTQWLAARTFAPASAAHPHSALVVARLSDHLRAAAQGGWPALDAEGGLALPFRGDRRKHTRRPLVLPVRIQVSDVWYDAHTFDISAGGIGLQDTPPLAPRERIVIALPDGTHLQAHVAWARGPRAGVLIDNPVLARRILQSLGST